MYAATFHRALTRLSPRMVARVTQPLQARSLTHLTALRQERASEGHPLPGSLKADLPSESLKVDLSSESLKADLSSESIKVDLSSESTQADLPSESIQVEASAAHVNADAALEAPWYLRADPTEEPALPEAPLATLPPHAPASLHAVANHLHTTLGLEGVRVFDMELADEEVGARFLGDYMVVATGRSPRHLIKSAMALTEYVKHEYDTVPYSEGLLKNAQMQLQHKRLQKRARKRTTANVDDDYGVVSNSWIMVDCKVDGICVNFLTSDRREELNLEYLWCSAEEKALYEPAPVSFAASDSIFSGIRSFHTRASSRALSSSPQALGLEESSRQGDTAACLAAIQAMDLVSESSRTLALQSFVERAVGMLEEQAAGGEVLAEAAELLPAFDSLLLALESRRAGWEARSQLVRLLHRLDAGAYPLSLLSQSLVAQQAAGVMVSAADVEFFAGAVAELTPTNGAKFATNEHMDLVAAMKLDTISQLLESVVLVQGNALKVSDALADSLAACTVQPGVVQPEQVGQTPVVAVTAYAAKAMARLLRFLAGVGVQPLASFVARALAAYASARDWRAFYAFWDVVGHTSVTIDADGSVVDSRPWVYMFTLVASTGDKKACARALDECYPLMRSCGVVLDSPLKEAVRQTVVVLADELAENSYLEVREAVLS